MENSNITSANDFFCSFGEQRFYNEVTNLHYTECVREIALYTESFWFLDIIASYQKKLVKQTFQVWKLEREFSYTEVNDVKIIQQRKDCFNVICEDGNSNVLLKQKIPFSDFAYDLYTVWHINSLVLLPSEY
jgi:hypothetical protein